MEGRNTQDSRGKTKSQLKTSMALDRSSDNSSESSFEANQPQDMDLKQKKSPRSSGKFDLNKSWDFSLSLEESKDTTKKEN